MDSDTEVEKRKPSKFIVESDEESESEKEDTDSKHEEKENIEPSFSGFLKKGYKHYTVFSNSLL